MTLRSIILPVHRWFGLIAGLFLIVLGVTGTVLVAGFLIWYKPKRPAT